MGFRFIFAPTLTGFFTMLDSLWDFNGDIVSIERVDEGRQGELFGDAVMIEEEASRAERALARLRLSGELSVGELSRAFLSGQSIGFAALHYCRLAFYGSFQKLDDETDLDIRAIKVASRKVMKEVDRCMGILRFTSRRDGALIAAFEPDSDILELLLPHFLDRFGDTPFMIQDRKRGKAGGTALSDEALPGAAGAEAVLNNLVENEDPLMDDIEELWRVFYRATENPARWNPSLRRQFLPLRYWKHLPELIDGDP